MTAFTGAATAGVDYRAVADRLTIPAYVTSRTLNVDVLGDKAIEPDERFNLWLSNISDPSVVFTGTRATIGGVGTLVNDDFAEQLVLTQSGSSTLSFLDPKTGQTRTIKPFAPDFSGSVNAAVGDFNGDGINDVAGGPVRAAGLTCRSTAVRASCCTSSWRSIRRSPAA